MCVRFIRRSSSVLFSLTLSAIFILYPSSVRAQALDADRAKAMALAMNEAASKDKEGKEEISQEMHSYIRYLPSSKIKAASGKVEITESEFKYSCTTKFWDRLPVKFSLDHQYIGIKDSVGVGLPAHLVGVSGDIETTFPFFGLRETYLRVGISPSFYGDDWDFVSSSFRIPSRLFLIHIPDEKWVFLAGIGIYPDFQSEILPILGFIYKPNERLTFNIVPKRPNISYLASDTITLFVEGGGSLNSEFEVDKDNLKHVVLCYKETRLGGGLEFRFNKFMKTYVSIGGVFNRSLKYRDSLGKVVMRDGWYSEFRTEIGF